MDSCSATVGAVPSLSTISSSAQASASSQRHRRRNNNRFKVKNDPLKENLVKPTSENVVLSSSERGSVQPSLFLEVSTKKKLPWRAYRETKRTQARESTEALKMNSQIDIPSGSNSEKIASRTTKSRKSTKKNPPFHFNPNAEPFVPRTTSFQGGTTETEDNKDSGLRKEKSQRKKASHEKKMFSERKRNWNSGRKDISLKDRLVRELENCTYECAICYQRITSKQGTWSCDTCYHIFHISHGCIIDWAKSSREDDNKWRCPTCQTKYERMPYNYFCFCGKQKNPTFELGSTPHTCDGVCEKKRGPDCPHPCTDRCHPGPCNECPLQVVRTCNCGAEEKTVRCGSKIVMKCEKVCGKMLKCGNHRCTNVCHSGDCDSCNERVFQVCYCGKENREVSCGNDPQTSFSCKSPCRGTYSCGIHKCERRCHEKWDNGCGDCPMSAAKVTHCPCGKKSLDELKVVRSECTDAIPTCEAVCGKILECGSKGRNHRCAEKCHAGPCPPCLCGTGVTCRCGNKKTIISCLEFVEIYKSGNQPYLCEKRCRKKKSCGIHKCQEDCCVQDEHFCMQICNKRLPCGNHNCDNICHAGQCPRCLNASFDEQYCHCGRTIRPPPVPCGSSLPECHEKCVRQHRCAHPVTHNCHGEERCPPCTFLTEKYCYGKHVLRKNIPCHIEAVSCGMECGLELSCGVHNCNRKCHSAPCEQNNTACVRPCNFPREGCEHACSLPCHGTTSCPSSLCKQKVEVTCTCGRRKTQLHCFEVDKMFAGKSEKTTDGFAENSEGKLKRCSSMTELNCLECDEDCKKLERNKKLAIALDIELDESGETILLPTITYSDYLKNIMKSHPDFVKYIEKVIVDILKELNDPMKSQDCFTLHMDPMGVEKRRFIHNYAQYFKLESYSVDISPKRSIVLKARRGYSSQPLILLSDLPNYRGALATPGPITLRKDEFDSLKKKPAEGPVESEKEGLKPLRSEREVYKRVPQTLTIRPRSPVQQSNPFSVLDSDVEEVEEKCSEQKQKDWWDDPETKEITPANESEVQETEEVVALSDC